MESVAVAVASAEPDVEILKIISHVADRTSKKFADFVVRDDVYAEIYLYYLDNQRRMERWRDEGEKFRLFRALYGAGRKYAETEKAQQSGYEFSDIAWYEPVQLWRLLPLALNAEWDGLTGDDGEVNDGGSQPTGSEGGTLLAMVCDIRRVLRGKKMMLDDFNPEKDGGQENLEWLGRLLGGEYPSAPGYVPGRRKALSNAQAIAQTERVY